MIKIPKELWYVFGAGIAFGFLFSALLITGVDISPPGLLANSVTRILNSLKNISPNLNVNGFLFYIKLVSIAGTLITIAFVIALLRDTGKLGITLLSIGFASMILIFIVKDTVSILIGVILIISGNLICRKHEGDAPENYINSWV